MKIVVNADYGMFDLSKAALTLLGVDDSSLYAKPGPCRADLELVRVVEKLGEAASAYFASLDVVEIPDGVQWLIVNYDGRETVHWSLTPISIVQGTREISEMKFRQEAD